MRGIFFDAFKEAMKQDKNIFFLMGDTGINLVEPLFEMAPERTLNVGIAEQNMIGIASGLCNAGYMPVCYAITNFIVHRCLEQIRDDVCLHKYKIILLGTSSGFDMGRLGATHHILDDIGCLKPLPNINIFSPSGRKSMACVFKESFSSSCASFIRMPKGDYIEECPVNETNHFILRQDNTDVLVIAHGKMVRQCAEAFSISPKFSLFAMDRIKPLDDEKLLELFKGFRKVVVVEDNFNSGLFNSICQWVVENKMGDHPLYSISPKEGYEKIIGDSEYLDDKNGLTPKKIAERINSIGGKENG